MAEKTEFKTVETSQEDLEELEEKIRRHRHKIARRTALVIVTVVAAVIFVELWSALRTYSGFEVQASAERKDSAATGQVIGIESIKGAVLDANRNATINGIVNARYVCGKAEEELPKMMVQADVAILDPPRAGCDERLLEAVVKAEPEKIVYVSCDPATLARDIKWLGEHGYEFKEATPCDMFPWTGHVETVCLLSRNK